VYRSEPSRLAGGVRQLLVIEHADPEHDDPDEYQQKDRYD
jgi:hypothetical protein